MATLLVSFEIHWDSAESYNKIHSALDKVVNSNPPVTRIWSETTSFYVVETSLSSAGFVKHIVANAGLRETKDRLLVLDANVKSGAAWGKIDDADLYVLLPFVKKL